MSDSLRFPGLRLLLLTAVALLGACGGGSGSSSTSPSSGTLLPPGPPLVRASGPSPFGTNCGGAMTGSTLYENAEVEPYLAVNPINPSNLIGVWQQDRWSDGGAHGLIAARSLDGGKTWSEQTLRFSVCAGGNYERASDPWVTFSPNGVAHAISISFSGNIFAAGSVSSVLVSRSVDGGATWSDAATLIQDGASAFNDKESITADPLDPNYVYAVWDRLDTAGFGPTYFARSTDGGQTWGTAAPIYDPGLNNQTLGNVIVGLAGGTLVNAFEEIDGTNGGAVRAAIKVIRSTDHGATWSAPVTVAQVLSVGVRDPDTGAPVRSSGGLPQIAAGPGNLLAVAWQDARFSGGQHDGIAYSQSLDGGQTWSAPVQINTVASVPAFTPSIAVRADGTIGISYFDFRNNTPNLSTLITDCWLSTSSDGANWTEQHLCGPFDMDLAPNAEGLFIGDYQALGVIGQTFVPFFAQTNNQGTANRTDIYVLPPQPAPLSLTRRATYAAAPAPAAVPTPAFRQRVQKHLLRLLRSETPGWDRLQALRSQHLNPP